MLVRLLCPRRWRINDQLASKLCLFSQCGRNITSGEAATALRPFLFIVHPDLFGQHPKERAVNEDSLKKLNEYVTCLQAGRPTKPTQATFFIRTSSQDDQVVRNDANRSFHQIQISLVSHDLSVIVKEVLKSCDLSLDYLNMVNENKSSTSTILRPISWHHTYYSYTGKKNPEEMIRKAPDITLRTWLRKNAERAREGLKASQPIRDEIERVSSNLKEEIGLADIRWSSPWSYRHFRGSLRSFEQLYREHTDIIISILEGRSLVFSNSTGFSLHGEIVLGSEDVPTDWLKLLVSVPAYDTVMERLPYMEDLLSSLLNNMQLIRKQQQRVITAPHYELMLNRLINSLRCAQTNVTSKFFAEDLSHLELVVDSEEGPLTMSPTGQFMVPASQPANMVIDFISANKIEAGYIMAETPRTERLEVDAVDHCKTKLELMSILKDENVTSAQMIDCCGRLTENCFEFCQELQNMCLKISHYFTVMEDGQILIPWDWKLESDTC